MGLLEVVLDQQKQFQAELTWIDITVTITGLDRVQALSSWI